MNKTLVIAEKPSVAADIAKVLQCKKKGEGCYLSDDYIVSWAVGHLVTLCDPEDYDIIYKKWQMNLLPVMPDEIKLKPIEKTKKQLNILKKLMLSKEVSGLICATDSGREGELIFRYIYEITGCKKPFHRLWISSMTDEAIREGFKNIKPGSEYDHLYESAKCRSEADWLVGINATRAYTLKFDALLSVGRVQTPTLAIIVNRQKEINDFVPKDYWQLKGDFGKFKGLWFDQESKENKIMDRKIAEEIAQKVKGEKGIIEKIEKEKKVKAPGLLYDLTLLQRECNRKYGFSAQDTLSIAQELYEKRKMITYPRTDSQYLSEDMKDIVIKTIQKLDVEPYCPYVSYLNSLEKLPFSKRIIDGKKVTDHHAIIPTMAAVNIQKLSEKEFKVYDLVVRKFLAAFYPSYVYNVTKIITLVKEQRFMVQGNTVVALGWRELYKDEKAPKKGDDEVDILPDVKKNEEVTAFDVEILDKKTTPPKPYNEEYLLSAMENAGRFVEDETLKEQLKESGIGTPATRAAIIERIIQVGYVTRKGKNLLPTEKGMKLIEIVPPELKSPETTGKWEKGLTSISKGKMEPQRFMQSINRYVYYIVENARKADKTIVFPENPNEPKKKFKVNGAGKCPQCSQGEILENSKSFYCSKWKHGCKFTIWKDTLTPYGIQLDFKMVQKILADKSLDVAMVMPQTGENCKAKLQIDIEKNPKIRIMDVTRV